MGDSRYNKRKNLIFNNRIFLKKKIICITLIIILISTVFSPVTSSKDTQNSVDNNSDFFYDESEKPLRYKLGSLLDDLI